MAEVRNNLRQPDQAVEEKFKVRIEGVVHGADEEDNQANLSGEVGREAAPQLRRLRRKVELRVVSEQQEALAELLVDDGQL